MDIINQLTVVSDMNVNREGGCIFVVKPTVLDPLPAIDPASIDGRYLKIFTADEILTDLEELIIDNRCRRIYNINTIDIDCCDNYYECDYCHNEVADNFYYCGHCYKDMCKLCYEETSEEIAIQNNAALYKEREPFITQCRAHHLLKQKPVYTLNAYYTQCTCDLCDTELFKYNSHYTCKQNECETFDICEQCFQTKDEAKNMVRNKQMQHSDHNDRLNYPFHYAGLNSMLYWFPVIRDFNDCRVLINLNPEDEHYGKICLSATDDNGCEGFFTINDDTYTLSKVLERLNDICSNIQFKYIFKDGKSVANDDSDDDAITVYMSPITMLMQEFNMPTDYA